MPSNQPFERACGSVRMKNRLLVRLSVFAMVAALGGACMAAPPAAVETRPTNKQNYQPAFKNQTRAPNLQAGVKYDVSVVASGLVTPWGFDFLPDGRIIVTERSGQFRVIAKDGTLSPPFLDGVPKVDF